MAHKKTNFFHHDIQAVVKEIGKDRLREVLALSQPAARLLRNCCDMSDKQINADKSLAAQMLACGVVSPELTASIYSKLIHAADKLVDAERIPIALTILKFVQQGAKLALDAEVAQLKLVGPLAANLPAREGDPTTAFVESASPDQLRDTAKVLAELGILDRLAGRVDKQDQTH